MSLHQNPPHQNRDLSNEAQAGPGLLPLGSSRKDSAAETDYVVKAVTGTSRRRHSAPAPQWAALGERWLTRH